MRRRKNLHPIGASYQNFGAAARVAPGTGGYQDRFRKNVQPWHAGNSARNRDKTNK
jgi:hypothetical protein